MSLQRTSIQKASRPSSKRKRLWEGREGFHCSIIGTCLRREDIRKLARKQIFGLSGDMDDFQIHSNLVNQAAQRCPQAKALQKILDAKYRRALYRYSKADNDEAIRHCWNEDVANGSIAGAYWAVMSHPAISNSLRYEIYGQVHMLSHDFFVMERKEKDRLRELTNKVAMLEEVLGSERQYHRDAAKTQKQDREKLEVLQGRHDQLEEENKKLRTMLEDMQSGKEHASLNSTIAQLKEQLVEARQEYLATLGREDALKKELGTTKKELRTAAEEMKQHEEQHHTLLQENSELHKEISSMETALLFGASANTAECTKCPDQNSARCPGPNLCGKTILYVGGLHKMVPRYRQLVEEMGGNFIHHDGGKEASRSILPRMLHTADAVFCPVDCVSHDATNCVKRLCKQHQKPFVMMRSSGLSSLAKGLSDIVQ
ncbi:MAG: hypothetical protein CSA20_01845 [Deltaproteobacteria bacterium]|nr:MAG: hypothetical protein CSA20_01845 [Deltaproteobacteria bacterium]